MPLPKFSLQFDFSWSVYFSNRTESYSSQIEFAGPHGTICNFTFSYLILSKTIGRKRLRTWSLVGADLGQLVILCTWTLDCTQPGHDPAVGSSRTWHSFTWYHAHSTVVVITHEESRSAMVGWMMFDAALSDIAGLSNTIFFRFQVLIWIIGERYRFHMAAWTIEAFSGHRMWGERNAYFSSAFGEEAFLLTIFLRDIDSDSETTQSIPVVYKKSDIHTLPSWCTTDDMTNRQANRKTKLWLWRELRVIPRFHWSRRLHLLPVVLPIYYMRRCLH